MSKLSNYTVYSLSPLLIHAHQTTTATQDEAIYQIAHLYPNQLIVGATESKPGDYYPQQSLDYMSLF